MSYNKLFSAVDPSTNTTTCHVTARTTAPRSHDSQTGDNHHIHTIHIQDYLADDGTLW